MRGEKRLKLLFLFLYRDSSRSCSSVSAQGRIFSRQHIFLASESTPGCEFWSASSRIVGFGSGVRVCGNGCIERERGGWGFSFVSVILGSLLVSLLTKTTRTTLSNGYLGSGNDEERSEMRYVMRIAEFSESSNLRTQIALPGYS